MQMIRTIEPGTFAALAAVVIALVSALFTVWNTGRTIRASVVSTNRQKWIDSIRDDLAIFLRLASVDHDHQYSTRADELWLIEDVETRKEMHVISLRIRLKLNPTEALHIAFIDMIEELRTVPRPHKDELPDQLARAGQDIFSVEWKRIKNGK